MTNTPRLQHQSLFQRTISQLSSQILSREQISKIKASKPSTLPYQRKTVHFNQVNSLQAHHALPRHIRPPSQRSVYNFHLWVLTTTIGVVLGLVLSSLRILLSFVLSIRNDFTETLLNRSSSASQRSQGDQFTTGPEYVAFAVLFNLAWNIALISVSSTIILYWAPRTQGAGLADIKGLLNGVNLKDYFTFKMLVLKTLVAFSTASTGIPTGMLASLIHIGCILSAYIGSVYKAVLQRVCCCTKIYVDTTPQTDLSAMIDIVNTYHATSGRQGSNQSPNQPLTDQLSFPLQSYPFSPYPEYINKLFAYTQYNIYHQLITAYLSQNGAFTNHPIKPIDITFYPEYLTQHPHDQAAFQHFTTYIQSYPQFRPPQLLSSDSNSSTTSTPIQRPFYSPMYKTVDLKTITIPITLVLINRNRLIINPLQIDQILFDGGIVEHGIQKKHYPSLQPEEQQHRSPQTTTKTTSIVNTNYLHNLIPITNTGRRELLFLYGLVVDNPNSVVSENVSRLIDNYQLDHPPRYESPHPRAIESTVGGLSPQSYIALSIASPHSIRTHTYQSTTSTLHSPTPSTSPSYKSISRFSRFSTLPNLSNLEQTASENTNLADRSPEQLTPRKTSTSFDQFRSNSAPLKSTIFVFQEEYIRTLFGPLRSHSKRVARDDHFNSQLPSTPTTRDLRPFLFNSNAPTPSPSSLLLQPASPSIPSRDGSQANSPKMNTPNQPRPTPTFPQRSNHTLSYQESPSHTTLLHPIIETALYNQPHETNSSLHRLSPLHEPNNTPLLHFHHPTMTTTTTTTSMPTTTNNSNNSNAIPARPFHPHVHFSTHNHSTHKHHISSHKHPRRHSKTSTDLLSPPVSSGRKQPELRTRAQHPPTTDLLPPPANRDQPHPLPPSILPTHFHEQGQDQIAKDQTDFDKVLRPLGLQMLDLLSHQSTQANTANTPVPSGEYPHHAAISRTQHTHGRSYSQLNPILSSNQLAPRPKKPRKPRLTKPTLPLTLSPQRFHLVLHRYYFLHKPPPATSPIRYQSPSTPSPAQLLQHYPATPQFDPKPPKPSASPSQPSILMTQPHSPPRKTTQSSAQVHPLDPPRTVQTRERQSHTFHHLDALIDNTQPLIPPNSPPPSDANLSFSDRPSSPSASSGDSPSSSSSFPHLDSTLPNAHTLLHPQPALHVLFDTSTIATANPNSQTSSPGSPPRQQPAAFSNHSPRTPSQNPIQYAMNPDINYQAPFYTFWPAVARAYTIPAFSDPESLRDCVSLGTVAGICAATGSLFGSILFAIDDFFTDSTTSDFFLRAILTVILVLICSVITKSIYSHQEVNIFNLSVKIEYFVGRFDYDYHLGVLAAMLVIGAVGGLFGVVFTQSQQLFLSLRNKIHSAIHPPNKQRWLRMIDTALFVALWTIICLLLPFAMSDCQPIPHSFINYQDKHHEIHHPIFTYNQFTCPPGFYNEFASLSIPGPNTLISRISARNVPYLFSFTSMITWLICYFCATVSLSQLTTGLGLMIPIFVMGGLVGRIIGLFIYNFMIHDHDRFPNPWSIGLVLDQTPHDNTFDPGIFAVGGIVALFASLTKSTIGMTAVTIETLGENFLFVPAIVASLSSHFVTNLISALQTNSFRTNLPYDAALKARFAQVLNQKRSKQFSRLFCAKNIMFGGNLHSTRSYFDKTTTTNKSSSNPLFDDQYEFLYCVGLCEQVWYLVLLLRRTQHNYYPVVVAPCRCFLLKLHFISTLPADIDRDIIIPHCTCEYPVNNQYIGVIPRQSLLIMLQQRIWRLFPSSLPSPSASSHPLNTLAYWNPSKLNFLTCRTTNLSIDEIVARLISKHGYINPIRPVQKPTTTPPIHSPHSLANTDILSLMNTMIVPDDYSSFIDLALLANKTHPVFDEFTIPSVILKSFCQLKLTHGVIIDVNNTVVGTITRLELLEELIQHRYALLSTTALKTHKNAVMQRFACPNPQSSSSSEIELADLTQLHPKQHHQTSTPNEQQRTSSQQSQNSQRNPHHDEKEGYERELPHRPSYRAFEPSHSFQDRESRISQSQSFSNIHLLPSTMKERLTLPNASPADSTALPSQQPTHNATKSESATGHTQDRTVDDVLEFLDQIRLKELFLATIANPDR